MCTLYWFHSPSQFDAHKKNSTINLFKYIKIEYMLTCERTHTQNVIVLIDRTLSMRLQRLDNAISSPNQWFSCANEQISFQVYVVLNLFTLKFINILCPIKCSTYKIYNFVSCSYLKCHLLSFDLFATHSLYIHK